jgi:hypothetical protein
MSVLDDVWYAILQHCGAVELTLLAGLSKMVIKPSICAYTILENDCRDTRCLRIVPKSLRKMYELFCHRAARCR